MIENNREWMFKFFLVIIILLGVICISDAGANNPIINRPVKLPDNDIIVSPTQTPPEMTNTSDLVLQQESINLAVQRKISTNLFYLIDSNASQRGLDRETVQKQMVAEGKLRTQKAVENGNSKTPATTLVTNLVLVYIDLVPTASTSAVDTYISSVTERNEQDHYVVAWVDINNLDTLASLDAVNNIRTAEPSITKDSPVYHDTKFVNKRAGLAPATVEEAKASIRAFEKVPAMTLEQKGTMKTSRGDVYEMESDSGRYYVNVKTGNVELASYSYYSNFPVQNLKKSNAILSGKSQASDPVTMESALAISQDFAAQNYQNFYNRTLVLTRSQLIDHGDAGKTWLFIWNEKINDILTPNAVSVSMNAYNGKILSYIGIDQPLETNVIPSISKMDAIGNAVNRFSPITVTDISARLAALPVDEKIQKLVWLVNVRGEPEDNVYQGGSAVIDAHSGEVMEVDPYA